jgi:iron complex outermembrane recepter protein
MTYAALAAHPQTEQTTPSPPPDFTALKIEDLMNVDVTSASKKPQKISRVPAAIFVITQQDIERSGATNLPDLLRMVPGLEVAQITASTWAITARGINGQYVNKLLVLIDGLVVYSPIFSGVYWDVQHVQLNSIERIEIIRGPGASVWGANAVNGVININTKRAWDTQTTSISGHGGNTEFGGSLRYGGTMGGSLAYRIFADSRYIDHNLSASNQDGHDDWYLYHAGLRVDTDISPKDSLVVQGEATRGNSGEVVGALISLQPPQNAELLLRTHFYDWHVLGRWKHVASPHSETSLQLYFDRSGRTDTTYGLGLNTIDADFQNHVGWGRRNDFVWGLGYRLNADRTGEDFQISFSPVALKNHIFSAFLQDEITMVPDRLHVILGAKTEREYFNGFNFQPTARVTWTPGSRTSFWAAVSGAQRTPSRVETAIRYNVAALPEPNGLPLLFSVLGNPAQKNERLTSIETGFRKDFSNRLSFDSTAFFNRYHSLRSAEVGSLRLESDPAPLHLLYPITFANLIHGETHGVELFANLKLASRWTLSPGYTFLTVHMHQAPQSTDPDTVFDTEASTPNQQAQLRSNVSLPWHLQWTSSAFFVGRLVAQSVPAYTRVDTNLQWQVTHRFSLGAVGQNLQASHHLEYAGRDLTENPTLVRRGAYAWLTWRF